jgi:hypothetical protein
MAAWPRPRLVRVTEAAAVRFRNDTGRVLCFHERGASRSAGLVPALKEQPETEGCPSARASVARQMLKSRFGSPVSHHLLSRHDRNLALRLAAPCVARTAGNRSDQRGRCWQRVVLLAREHLVSEGAARHLRSFSRGYSLLIALAWLPVSRVGYRARSPAVAKSWLLRIGKRQHRWWCSLTRRGRCMLRRQHSVPTCPEHRRR